MKMTIDEAIHKLDFSIGAYQKLIDENVANGEVVGTGVRGTWTASTPLNKAYSDMIEALQTAKDTMYKYQKIEQEPILDKIKAEIIKYEGDCRLSVDEYPSCKQCTDNVFKTIYGVLDKYKAESEENHEQTTGD